MNNIEALAELKRVSDSNDETPTIWPAPEALRSELEHLPRISEAEMRNLAPNLIAERVIDVAKRLGVGPETVATAVFSALSGVVGRTVGMRPRAVDDWTVYPCCLWGMIIGRPGSKKSPLIQEAMKPVFALEQEAYEKFEAEMVLARPKLKVLSLRRAHIEKQMKGAISNGENEVLEDLEKQERALEKEEFDSTPKIRRFFNSDSTRAALLNLLAANPNGLLVYRDELLGLIQSFDQPGCESLRTFYLELWSGNGRTIDDRVGSGTRRGDALAATILGSTQPGPLARVVTESTDGLMQRFLLMISLLEGASEGLDMAPNNTALDRLTQFCRAISRLNGKEPTHCRFAADAQEIANEWMIANNRVINDTSTGEALRGHFAKYPSFLSALSLILHLAERFENGFPVEAPGEVSATSVGRAAEWIESVYRPHARYVYQRNSSQTATEKLAQRIRSADVVSGMTVNKLCHSGWEGLSNRALIDAAMDELTTLNWLRVQKRRPKGGGRPSDVIILNPAFCEGGANA